MLLIDKVTVIFGGSGAIDSATAQAMAREGAHMCLDVRGQEKLDRTVSIIRTAGGTVETFITGVLNEHNASKRVIHLIEQIGGIDVVVNATGFMHKQDGHINTLSLSESMNSITPFLSTQFNITRTTTPHMDSSRVGVILSAVAPTAPMAIPDHLSRIVGCAGIEAFIKAFASEAGPVSIRAVGVHSHTIMDTVAVSSHTGEIFSVRIQPTGLAINRWLGGTAQSIMPARPPTLAQIAEVIAFFTSGHADVMTATVVSITGGATRN